MLSRDKNRAYHQRQAWGLRWHRWELRLRLYRLGDAIKHREGHP